MPHNLPASERMRGVVTSWKRHVCLRGRVLWLFMGVGTVCGCCGWGPRHLMSPWGQRTSRLSVMASEGMSGLLLGAVEGACLVFFRKIEEIQALVWVRMHPRNG